MSITNLKNGKKIAEKLQNSPHPPLQNQGAYVLKTLRRGAGFKIPGKSSRISLHMFFVFHPIDVLFVEQKRKNRRHETELQALLTPTQAEKKRLLAVELPSGLCKSLRDKNRGQNRDKRLRTRRMKRNPD